MRTRSKASQPANTVIEALSTGVQSLAYRFLVSPNCSTAVSSLSCYSQSECVCVCVCGGGGGCCPGPAGVQSLAYRICPWHSSRYAVPGISTRRVRVGEGGGAVLAKQGAHDGQRQVPPGQALRSHLSCGLKV